MYLEAKVFTPDELLKAGITKTTESGKEPFDVFRDRIMFPMSEPSGKIVAFSGRILHPDEKTPKYVNSPETLLYKKSELLYGYDKAKNSIRQLDFSLIVEGQFDAVMCHQAGYSNAVAVSGTALTVQHVQLLERLSNRVVLSLDADRAGISAMKKAAAVMLRRGLDVKVAELPLGQDPADVISVNPDAFKKVIGESVHVIEFLLHVLRREIADSRSFKLKVQEEVLPFILLLPSRIDQEHFVGKVAESIRTTVDAVRYELERQREQLTTTTERESKMVSTTEKKSVVTARRSSDVPQKAYEYLLAAAALVDMPLSAQLQEELKKMSLLGELVEPGESERARLLFTVEQQYVQYSPLTIAEEVVARLNQCKSGLIRKQLMHYREILRAVEDQGETVPSEETMAKIKVLEAKLREPAYQVETFLGDTKH